MISNNVDVIIRSVVLQKAQIFQRIADLRLELQDHPVLISESHLVKVIEEIVDNAFKFSKPETPVEIVSKLATNGLYFNICITDWGRGMTAGEVDQIGAYMQFQRNVYEQQGMGLGLIIAKRLVVQRGGNLTIESIPGKQTVVTIALPIAQG